MLRPIDIHNMEFKRVFRGYSEKEVDEFLSKVVTEYETLYQENKELKERIEELKQQVNQYTDMGQSLKDTLAFVKKSAAEVKAEAERTARRLVEEAEREKESSRQKAEQEAEQLLAEARRQIEAEMQRAKEALEFRRRTCRQVKSLLQRLLVEVEELDAVDAGDDDYFVKQEEQTRVMPAYREAAVSEGEVEESKGEKEAW